MTVLHDDVDLDDKEMILSQRQLKKLPRWAKSKIIISL